MSTFYEKQLLCQTLQSFEYGQKKRSINILSCWNYQGKFREFVSPNWVDTMVFCVTEE